MKATYVGWYCGHITHVAWEGRWMKARNSCNWLEGVGKRIPGRNRLRTAALSMVC